MTPLDRSTIEKRKRKLRIDLSKQCQLPKASRDHREVESIKKRIAVLDKWLNEKDAKPIAQNKRITKTEFREQYKKEFDIQDPSQIIEIHTIEDLDKAWPAIRGKNIQVRAPQEVKEEIRRRVVAIARATRVNGFR